MGKIAAILVLGAVVVPWIAQTGLILARLITAAAVTRGSVLASPIAWAAGGALAFAFLPVVYLLRTWQD